MRGTFTQDYTLPDGEVLTIRRVHHYLRWGIYKKYPRPDPPVVEVPDLAGGTRKEANPDDPVYALKLSQWAQIVTNKATLLLYGFGVILSDDQQQEVDDFRAKLLAVDDGLFPSEEEVPTALAWLTIVRGYTEEVVDEVARAINALGRATEEATAKAVETF